MGCLLAMAPPVSAITNKTEQACQAYGEERMRAAQMLLARGGSPAGGVGKPGRSLVAIVLRWVHIEGRFDKRSEEYVIRMVDLLLVHGFSRRLKHGRGVRHPRTVERLTHEPLTEMVKHGADINARDSTGQTIAHRCVLESRSAPATGELLAWQRLGLDFSLRDARGRTPAEAYREWRAGLRSNPYFTYEQDQVQRVLENLQAKCQAACPP